LKQELYGTVGEKQGIKTKASITKPLLYLYLSFRKPFENSGESLERQNL